MGIKEFRYDGSQALELNKTPTSLQGLDRDKIQEKTLRNMEAIGQWQDKLYADGREGIVILLQAMDAAGKDSAIKHVMGCVNPQGLTVHSFKQPSPQELAHDYLWRAVQALPLGEAWPFSTGPIMKMCWWSKYTVCTKSIRWRSGV